MIQKTLRVTLDTGLQARPAASFVQQANRFHATVYLEKENKSVNAKSIMGLMSLAIAQDELITLKIDGADEAQAMKELTAFITAPSAAS
ncbi:HPr family phosphocarrier protein [Terribacillus halophilus]|uniref:HPr family phosphocarrier protein n=1 Tax=Terribacillus halophilus TaxID=361279 RepID=UPI000986A0BF|nr:HPr family phosphocarrier protein [Terribacillus halophilus]